MAPKSRATQPRTLPTRAVSARIGVTPLHRPSVPVSSPYRAPAPRTPSIRRKNPVWLLWLKRLRFLSGLVAVLTTASALGVYSLTDRTRQEWNAGRETLDTLRRQERQLTATLSELDNRQTTQMYANPGALQRVKPATAVFAPVAPLRPEAAPPTPPPPGPPAQPLGY